MNKWYKSLNTARKIYLYLLFTVVPLIMLLLRRDQTNFREEFLILFIPLAILIYAKLGNNSVDEIEPNTEDLISIECLNNK